MGATVQTSHGKGVELLEMAVSTLIGGVLQGPDGNYKNHEGDSSEEFNRSKGPIEIFHKHMSGVRRKI
jgi:hypothetical protein